MNILCRFDHRSKRRRQARRPFRGFVEPLEQRLELSAFVVNSTGDQPALDPSAGAETAAHEITLRSAIQAANAHPNDASGPDRIAFNIPGNGIQRIVPSTAFPTITDAVVIDGYSQPGAKANTLAIGSDAALRIQLDSALGLQDGLRINAGNTTVRGLVFNRFSGNAITLSDHGGDVVAGNFIGVTASGDATLGGGIGVYVVHGSDSNSIGGTDPADRNVISGNAMGLRIVASSNNVVQGNYFGLRPSGLATLGGNGQGNIIVTSGAAGEVAGAATGNLIGGTVGGARNVIAGGGAGIIFGGDQASLTSGNLVQGNFIGTDANGGGLNFANNRPGVLLDTGTGSTSGAKGNTIGGVSATARNVIANNTAGILVAINATDNVIRGNYIGTDATGAVKLGNGAGIDVRGSKTMILDNLVSGSTNDGGIVIRSGGDESVIQGNLVGTTAAGTGNISNVYGIVLSDSNRVTIGGTTTGARNIVSGNAFSAVYLNGSGVGHRILGNVIGPDINGSNLSRNGGDGILIDYEGSGTSRDTIIGGPEPGAGNTIAFNNANGVEIRTSTKNNETDGAIESNTIFSNSFSGILLRSGSSADPHFRITRNSIFSNSYLGIDLDAGGNLPAGDGVTPNDSKGHVGPNKFQNFPVLASATTSSTATLVSGTLKSTPNLPYRIEFFANADKDSSGHGEGQTFLGFTVANTDAAGNASFDNVSLPPVPDGQAFVTATAADFDGNTSEFSTSAQVANLAIAATATPDPVERGGLLTYTFTIKNAGPDGAEHVNFATAIPARSTFASFTAPAGWTASLPPVGGSGNVSAAIDRIENGATAVFSLVVRVDQFVPDTDALTATASVTSNTTDVDTTDNIATVSASVPRTPDHTDLAITVIATPTSVRQGGTVTYTVTANNLGPIAAGNNSIRFHLPSRATFQSIAAPDGWDVQPPLDGVIYAGFRTMEVGATAVISVVVSADATAEVGSAVTAVADIVSETLDSNEANNTAQASATVARVPAAEVAVAISSDINLAKIGQDVTYTITVSNPSGEAAPGVVVHVAVPGTITLIALGGGSSSPSGVDLGVGELAAGSTKRFQVKGRPLTLGTVAITAVATAGEGVSVGGPASVTTVVVGTPAEEPPPAATPPTVVSASRYGFHAQPTILVVTFGKGVAPDRASDPTNYRLLVRARRNEIAVPISKIYYDAQTHQATLRAARPVYLSRPWQLIVRRTVTDLNGNELAVDGVPGRDYSARMDRSSLLGRASEAPGASRVGVKAAPAGPLRSPGKNGPAAARTAVRALARLSQ